MKRLNPILTLLLVLTLGALPAMAAGPDSSSVPLAVSLGPGSTLWLDGTSTIHEYESRTSELVIGFARDSGAPPPADVAGLVGLIRNSGVRQVDVRVPVLTLKSKKSGLDKNLWRSLKAEAHPDIRCRLSRYTVKGQSGDTLDIRAEGTLEVAGHTRPISLDARAWRAAEGIWVTGIHPLLMSDYGIKPPTMMMGTLRVADRVTVHYRLLLTPKSGNEGTPSAAGKEKGTER